jgi:hypothetical protein
MKIYRKFFAALVIPLGVAGIAPPTMSAEPGKYFKFTCMPELNSVEVATVYSEYTLSDEVRQKYNFRYLDDYDCEFDNGVKVTLKFEQMTWDGAVEDGKFKGRAWYPYGADDLNWRLKVLKDDVEVIVIEDFGTSSFDDGNVSPNQFPQLFSYDGISAKACFGLLTRECRIFNPQE